jgi:hypothetical protein
MEKTSGKKLQQHKQNMEACPQDAPMGQFGPQQIQYEESNIFQKQLKYNAQFHLSHLLLRDCYPSVIYHI